MRDRRANALFLLALLMAAAAFCGYAFVVLRWLAPRNASAPTRVETDSKLIAARREYRAKLLDPAAHLRLSEALWSAGRLVDSFYVTLAARELFGEEAFRRAHADVVLHVGGPAAALLKRLDGVSDPAVAIPLTLPWMTGAPYAAYARVRAVTRAGTSQWSSGYGFNIRWKDVPQQSTSYPGLAR